MTLTFACESCDIINKILDNIKKSYPGGNFDHDYGKFLSLCENISEYVPLSGWIVNNIELDFSYDSVEIIYNTSLDLDKELKTKLGESFDESALKMLIDYDGFYYFTELSWEGWEDKLLKYMNKDSITFDLEEDNHFFEFEFETYTSYKGKRTYIDDNYRTANGQRDLLNNSNVSTEISTYIGMY